MGIRAWVLRQAMGRLRITDDIVRHLTTFQRLGETVEVQLPSELLPVGARTLFRAVRTRGAAQLGVDWVWPYWLERQLDPRSPAFVPRGHLPVTTNMTGRNWTGVAPPHCVHKAIVDRRGLLTPWFDGWSLDWWIGTGSGWHLPSRAREVRQALIGGTPVVETVMPVDGGDAAGRVYAVGGDEPLVVLEIVNRTSAALTAALAIRPYNPEGLAVIERIEMHGRTVTVDGRPGLFLPRDPKGIAASNFHDGDSALAVMAGQASDALPPGLRCDAGLAQAAFLFDLDAGERLRAAVPLAPHRRARRRAPRERAGRVTHRIETVPSADDVVRSWQAETDRDVRLRLPPGALADAVEANRRYLLVFHDGEDVTPGPFTYHRFWFRDAAYLLAAMDRFGFHAEAAQVLRSYAGRQHLDGFFFSQRQEWDANGAALWSLAEHWRLTRETGCIDAASVLKAVRWIERKRNTRRRRNDPSLRGLMPASISAEHLGPFDYFYWDSFWSLRGLVDGALLLGLAGLHDEAAEARGWAEDLRRDLARSMTLVAERLATDIIPAGPRRRIDPAVIGSLVACSPLRLLPATHPGIAATVEAIRQRFCIGPAFFQAISHTGLGTYLTLQLAEVELEAGDRRALSRLEWMAEVATPTFTWPEAIHPHLGDGCMGDGHHGWAAADFLSLVRNLLVREVGPEDQPSLALCTMLPDAWSGKDLEVQNAPTHAGRLSFALSWRHGQPLLRWRLDRHRDLTHAVAISAPGLDPGWSSAETSGQAILGQASEDATVGCRRPP
ncbi:MAG TPA: hypothetical protein VHF27_06205, partial [Acidimicrobiales bacterium]|nr:hypothetical protein [Acidimicrobiales bacterium]